MSRDNLESKGRGETMVNGVTFRLEIERLRDTIIAHVLDHDAALERAINDAVLDCLRGLDGDITAMVERVMREVTEKMIREKVTEAMYDPEITSAVREVVSERFKKALTEK